VSIGRREVADHAPPTLRTRDFPAVPFHLNFPRMHTVLSDASRGITDYSATVGMGFGKIDRHGCLACGGEIKIDLWRKSI
jgi:hypothetical protein